MQNIGISIVSFPEKTSWQWNEKGSAFYFLDVTDKKNSAQA